MTDGESLFQALHGLVEALDDEAGLTMSLRLANAWSEARQARSTTAGVTKECALIR